MSQSYVLPAANRILEVEGFAGQCKALRSMVRVMIGEPASFKVDKQSCSFGSPLAKNLPKYWGTVILVPESQNRLSHCRS